MGRGAVRGRRDRATDFYVRTRPDTLQSKKGTLGEEMACASNYFALIAKPNWRLLQYRVDMSPDVDNTRVRKALLYNQKSTLPKFMFDGTIMFTTSRLNPDDSPILLTSTRESDKATVRITIKLVGEVQPTDYHYMQFFNISPAVGADQEELFQPQGCRDSGPIQAGAVAWVCHLHQAARVSDPSLLRGQPQDPEDRHGS